ncbi:MAG TPA: altronate dehydratase, partial [Bordetella sp.]|nr:altronate dehydratase [Bordetella sp.]
GSAYGCAPAPSLKLSTNTDLWRRQQSDIDLNCGEVLDGTMTLAESGAGIFQAILDTASGRKTCSERHGYGQNEFVPWQLGVTT